MLPAEIIVIEQRVRSRVNSNLSDSQVRSFARGIWNSHRTVARPAILLGPIGVGKSTIARLVAQQEDSSFRALLAVTPDDHDSAFYKHLANFAANPRDGAFGLQVEALLSRFLRLLIATDCDVLDEGFFSDLVFSRYYAACDYLSPLQYETYFALFETLRVILPKPRVLVFLDAPVADLMRRIHRRGRKVETAYTAEYVGALRRGYALLEKELTRYKTCHIDTADSNENEVARVVFDLVRLA